MLTGKEIRQSPESLRAHRIAEALLIAAQSQTELASAQIKLNSVADRLSEIRALLDAEAEWIRNHPLFGRAA